MEGFQAESIKDVEGWEKLQAVAYDEAMYKLPANYESLQISEKIEVLNGLRAELLKDEERYIDVVFAAMIALLNAEEEVNKTQAKYQETQIRYQQLLEKFGVMKK